MKEFPIEESQNRNINNARLDILKQYKNILFWSEQLSIEFNRHDTTKNLNELEKALDSYHDSCDFLHYLCEIYGVVQK